MRKQSNSTQKATTVCTTKKKVLSLQRNKSEMHYIDYIRTFLLYGNVEASHCVGYTANQEEWKNYRVIILPKQTLYLNTTLPIEKHQETIIITEDIIYTAFLLLSRQIEKRMEKDEHGRACWQKNQALFAWIDKPILDVWGVQLLQLLGYPTPSAGFSGINLTHDVDTIAHYRHLRGFLGGIKRGEMQAAWRGFLSLRNDAAFTFHKLLEQDKNLKALKDVKDIYFIKATTGKGFDYPQYNLQGNDFQALATLLKSYQAQIGLHTSYADRNFAEQKDTLEHALGETITANRWHYLRTTDAHDFEGLVKAGFTDDYTMGFADYAGFRLGTCRPVHWINPNATLTTECIPPGGDERGALLLHPLTIMDCTLSSDNYMNLSEEEAFEHCKSLIDITHEYGGEVTLLWHNNTFGKGSYHDRLYPRLLDYIANKNQ